MPFGRPGHRAHLQRLVAQAVPVGQQQHVGAGQHLGRYRGGVGQLVVGGHGEHEVLGEQRFLVQLRGVDRQGQQPGVEVPTEQPLDNLLGLLLHPQQLDQGEALVKRAHHVGQEVRRQRREHADLQRRCAGLGGRLGQRLDLVDLDQHPAGMVEDQPPDRRGHHVAGGPLEQRHTQLVLQLAQLRGQGGLADETGFGGATEMPVIVHRHRVAQVLKVHVTTLRDGRSDEGRFRLVRPVGWRRRLGCST